MPTSTRAVRRRRSPQKRVKKYTCLRSTLPRPPARRVASRCTHPTYGRASLATHRNNLRFPWAYSHRTERSPVYLEESPEPSAANRQAPKVFTSLCCKAIILSGGFPHSALRSFLRRDRHGAVAIAIPNACPIYSDPLPSVTSLRHRSQAHAAFAQKRRRLSRHTPYRSRRFRATNICSSIFIVDPIWRNVNRFEESFTKK